MDDDSQQQHAGDGKAGLVEDFPAIAERSADPAPFDFEVEPVGPRRARRPGLPVQGQEKRQYHDRRVERPVNASHDPAPATVMLTNRFRRKGQQAEQSPAIGVNKPQDDADRNEQDHSQTRPAEAGKPEPQPERDERQRHRQGEIDEAEHERVAVCEGQSEQHGRRKAVVHLARNPQKTGDGQGRDRRDDELRAKLKSKQFGQGNDEQVDAQIAHQRPSIGEVTLKIDRRCQVELHPVTAHMARKIDERK